ncbi:hypothetical protein BV898_19256 [Hypsibius exemplaris]|uniref:Uncharacterized protein n=1 Tax=Hypsibius exemplaris TaxID=2072580 RepID=A0A9X6NRU5_HYPEX|nr:hypothetical protein BV898_19256 [Hypsibius exemplaris]
MAHWMNLIARVAILTACYIGSAKCTSPTTKNPDMTAAATESPDLAELSLMPSMQFDQPFLQNRPRLIRKTATLPTSAGSTTLDPDAVTPVMPFPETVLDNVISDADRMAIQPSSAKKYKINAITVRLLLTVDASNAMDGGASSIRRKSRTQTTTTMYTATDDAGILVAQQWDANNLAAVKTYPIAGSFVTTTTRNNYTVTVQFTTFAASTIGDGWTQSIEQSEFRWTKTL